MSGKYQLIQDGTHTWTVPGITKLKAGVHINSPTKTIDQLKFTIRVGKYFDTEGNPTLSFWVKCVPARKEDFADNWCVYCDIEFCLLPAPNSAANPERWADATLFHATVSEYGWFDYFPWKKLIDRREGYIDKDSIRLEIIIRDLIFFKFYKTKTEVPLEPINPRKYLDSFVVPLFAKKNKYTDVKIRIGEHKIYAHRLVMAAKNKFLDNLFYKEKKDDLEVILDPKEYDYEAFYAILRYYYRQELVVLENQVKKVHKLAKKINDNVILKACPLFVSVNNFFELLTYSIDGDGDMKKEEQGNQKDQPTTNGNANDHDNNDTDSGNNFYDQSLHTFLMEWLSVNSKKLLESEAFIKASRTDLKKVLVSDYLACNEYKIYYHTLKWAEECVKQQGKPQTAEHCRVTLGEALYLIRFPLMSPDEFKNVIEATILRPSDVSSLERYFDNPSEGKNGLKFSTQERMSTPAKTDQEEKPAKDKRGRKRKKTENSTETEPDEYQNL